MTAEDRDRAILAECFTQKLFTAWLAQQPQDAIEWPSRAIALYLGPIFYPETAGDRWQWERGLIRSGWERDAAGLAKGAYFVNGFNATIDYEPWLNVFLADNREVSYAAMAHRMGVIDELSRRPAYATWARAAAARHAGRVPHAGDVRAAFADAATALPQPPLRAPGPLPGGAAARDGGPGDVAGAEADQQLRHQRERGLLDPASGSADDPAGGVGGDLAGPGRGVHGGRVDAAHGGDR